MEGERQKNREALVEQRKKITAVGKDKPITRSGSTTFTPPPERKPIPGTNPVKYAVSKDGGKTWKAE
jgi:Neuraminidase (sialidase)